MGPKLPGGPESALLDGLLRLQESRDDIIEEKIKKLEKRVRKLEKIVSDSKKLFREGLISPSEVRK